jgi:pyruvate/2-oxoglutarate dehydrogenase complex dihydrolipoamide acyltransferase (E2) component
MRRVFVRLQQFTPVKLPALSPSMVKGTIQEWKVKVGDEVKDGTLWCVIGTDKAGLDFTERVREGWVAKLYAQNGDELPVGKVIALLVDEKKYIELADTYKLPEEEQPAAAAAAPPAPSTPPAAPAPVTPAAKPVVAKPTRYGSSLDDAIKASGPAVALRASRLDRQALESVAPTGKGGRFTKGDLAGVPEASSSSSSPSSVVTPSLPPPPTPQSSSSLVKATAVVDFTVSDTAMLKRLMAGKK